MVLNQAYGGLMTAFLLVNTNSVTIRSIYDLVKQKAVRWTYQSGTAHESLFKNSDGIYKQIGDGAADTVVTPELGFKMVREHGYAFLKDRSFVDVQIAKTCKDHNEKLIIAERDFYPVGFSLAVQRNSTDYERFNHFMLTCQQLGLWIHWKSLYWPDTENSCSAVNSASKDQTVLEFSDFEYILYLYLGCCFVCFLILIAEIYSFVRHVKRKMKNRRRALAERRSHLLFVKYPVYHVRPYYW